LAMLEIGQIKNKRLLRNKQKSLQRLLGVEHQQKNQQLRELQILDNFKLKTLKRLNQHNTLNNNQKENLTVPLHPVINKMITKVPDTIKEKKENIQEGKEKKFRFLIPLLL